MTLTINGQDIPHDVVYRNPFIRNIYKMRDGQHVVLSAVYVDLVHQWTAFLGCSVAQSDVTEKIKLWDAAGKSADSSCMVRTLVPTKHRSRDCRFRSWAAHGDMSNRAVMARPTPGQAHGTFTMVSGGKIAFIRSIRYFYSKYMVITTAPPKAAAVRFEGTMRYPRNRRPFCRSNPRRAWRFRPPGDVYSRLRALLCVHIRQPWVRFNAAKSPQSSRSQTAPDSDQGCTFLDRFVFLFCN